MSWLVRLCLSAVSRNDAALVFDEQFLRASPGMLELEDTQQSAPLIPFRAFSATYVTKALREGVDWRKKGAVTPVKNQGPHGYCGTFGRVGSAEGQYALKSGRGLVSFSEEELIDCIGWDKDLSLIHI